MQKPKLSLTLAPLPQAQSALLTQNYEFPPALAESHAFELARLCKALGDPTRLLILSILVTHRDRTATDQICVYKLVEGFRLEQPTISHHLRILRDAGLVSFRKRKLWVQYYIDDQKIWSILNMLGISLGVIPAEVADDIAQA